MRKILVIVLAFVLVLALAAGCGNNNAPEPQKPAAPADTNAEKTGKGLDWPESSLPKDFPKYPGGTIVDVDEQDGGVYIEVSETDRATYEAYMKTLASAGWVFQDYDFGVGADIAFKDGMMIILLQIDKTVGISFDEKGGKTYVDWPAEALPKGFPVYPNGIFVNFEQEEDHVRFYIEGSSKDDYDSFVEALKAAGWNQNPYESETSNNKVYTYTASNGIQEAYFVIVSWSESIASIAVYEIDYTDPDLEFGNGWPAEVFGVVREYPDGIISYVTFKESDNYRITVANTSVQAFNSYIETLINDGFEAVPLEGTTGLVSLSAFVFISMDDSSTVSISVDLVRETPVTNWVDGWPTSMPVSVPAYPDGDIKYLERYKGDSMAIIVEHTSQASYDAYIDTLVKDGWKLSGTRGSTDNTLTKGKSSIKLVLKDHQGNIWLHIDITY